MNGNIGAIGLVVWTTIVNLRGRHPLDKIVVGISIEIDRITISSTVTTEVAAANI